MDISEIKKLIKSKNDKIVIVEDGKPILVVTPYLSDRKVEARVEREPMMENKAGENQELTLDDLPFLQA